MSEQSRFAAHLGPRDNRDNNPELATKTLFRMEGASVDAWGARIELKRSAAPRGLKVPGLF